MCIEIETLSWRPRAFQIRRVLSTEECRTLIELAAPELKSAQVYERDGKLAIDEIRQCSAATLTEHRDHPQVRAINERLAALIYLPAEHGEPLHVVRYREGEGIGPHYDYFDRDNPDEATLLGDAGQRIATMILHLNDSVEGGETLLPRTNTVIRHERGSVLLLFNTLPDLTPDRMSLHCTAALRSGTRWVAIKWWREGSVSA
jgi:prolyl 4-hydroxylase